jgi:hypothetical protein
MDKKYLIKIKYTTGDSFSSEVRESNINLGWDDLENAKENLGRIKSHYLMIQELSSVSYDQRNSILESKSSEDWFVDRYHNVSLKLKADNGNYMQMSAFWCGYFEILHEAEIIINEDYESDLKIKF